ncbi:MAG: UvrD-helicase domain-containing protein [Candidatus Omnitrophica bacterium]|nr:UvrD-helicase domain-containing protein [Candidatus Omnitrophota bacterium]
MKARSPEAGQVLGGLNPEQNQAVTETQGPVLVLAGAGTGKTRVIAHRVAHLLNLNPDLSASNLLALTFSRRAAEEMRRRVEELLGRFADDLNCFTFHSFCHRFLQDHALGLGLAPRFTLLDRLESWIFMRRLLPEFKLKVHWNLADPSACIDGFLRFIGRAKDELVGPLEYAAWASTLSDAQEKAAAREMERVYRIYEERKEQSGMLDFGDLVVRTLKALQDHPALLAHYREKFRYILVDEFQDTNVAQIALVSLLAGPPGNLCVVGDDDQAIYRFRGASFASFLMMKAAYPQVRVLKLTQNYRSAPAILSAGARLIAHNEPDRFDPSKKIWTQNPSQGPVQVWTCSNEGHEAAAVRQIIESLYARQPEAERRFDRISVLYRAHAHKDLLVKELEGRKIPFHLAQGIELFEQEAIQMVIAFLRVVRNPADSLHLFRILSHPVWGVPLQELLPANRLAKERRVPLVEILRSKEPAGLSETLAAASGELLREMEQAVSGPGLSDAARLVPWAVESTFLKALFTPAPEPAAIRASPLAALGKFLRLVYRYAAHHPRAKGLEAFLFYLEAIEEIQADPFSDEEEEPGDRVRLMTVHQAKGLEFDWVILLSLIQGRFPSRARPEPVPFPMALMKETLPSGDWHLQEERRLCYVAATRARKGLILMTQERAYHRASVFAREMLEGAVSSEIRKEPFPSVEPLASDEAAEAASPAVERQVLKLLSQVKSLPADDQAGFEGLMAKLTQAASHLRSSPKPAGGQPKALKLPEAFSYSQLQTYRYCPAKYLYAYLYQIPVPATAQMTFGLDLHAVLEAFYRRMIETSEVAGLKELLASFEKLHAPGRYGEAAQDETYRQLGIKILTDFFKKHEGRWEAPLAVEKPFTLRLGDVTIRGVVDRIDRLAGGGVEIVDYKSGKPKEKADADERLQLRLYAVAAQEIFGLDPRRISFYYLQANEKLSFEEDPAALSQTREKILALANEIRSGDFTADPSPAKCRWCDFKRLCPSSLA